MNKKSKIKHNRIDNLRKHNFPAGLDKISFPSMESCEGATGIPKSLQQLAKTRGCLGFRASRVYLLDLVVWIFRESNKDTTVDWSKMSKEFDAKLKQVELFKAINKVRDVEEMESCIRDMAAIYFGAIRQWKLEFPRDFEMRSKDFIKQSVDRKHRELITRIKAHIETKIQANKSEDPKQ